MCRKLLNGGVLFLRWRVGCIQSKVHIRGTFLSFVREFEHVYCMVSG
jgi:hypothetical protein